ncbi:MAG: pentapeptide repeat-containing protein [Cyanobacteriota bacterium]|nr:pentapeptide repeat-containing protein [Cyanobacteriota bacterium]
MADPKHQALLGQGIETWNEWRKHHYDIIPDLGDADLRGTNLAGADLSRVNLAGANLGHANLFGVDLYDANLSAANLSGANLGGAFVNHANLEGANLDSARLWVAQLFQANLTGANLIDTDLSDAQPIGSNLSQARLTRTNLSGADLSQARLTRAQLIDVRATGTNFHEATLTGMYLASWHIDRTTQLSDAICDYLYLRKYQDKLTCQRYIDRRCPGEVNRHLRPGEFAKLFQSTPETIDFAFTGGIEWSAFLAAFEQVERALPGNEAIVQSLETRAGGTLVVRVQFGAPCNRKQIERLFARAYQHQLQALHNPQLPSLSPHERQRIETHRARSTDLREIVRGLARALPPVDRTQTEREEADRTPFVQSSAPWKPALEIAPES